MDKLQRPILNSILEVIRVANESIDIQNLRYKIMDVFFDTILADGIVFLSPDMYKSKGEVLLKNHEERYIELYKTYYYQFDPIKSGRMKNRVFGVDLLENMVDYDAFQSTEFYTDFLFPQKIHYILIANLTMDKRMEGTILLTRSKKSNRFDSDDIKIAKLISPHFSHSLFHNRLRGKVKLLQNIIDYLEDQSSAGMILLDKHLQVLHINKKGQEFLNDLKEPNSTFSPKKIINSKLLQDCRKLKSQLKNFPSESMLLPEQRILKGRHQKRFYIVSKTLEPSQEWEDSRLFIICIEKLPGLSHNTWQHLIDVFHLSPREVDVVPYLFSGLKNAEIAEKLFVSEITVKKHLQNIYAKVGVRNRTSLVNKILTCNSTKALPVLSHCKV
jgi:DNA-binding CsgD family transcriptional regulator